VTAREVVAAFGIDAAQVDTAAYGVDLDRFRPGQHGAEKLLRKRTGRAVAPYVLYVGSLLPRKNISALREAMTMLAADGFSHNLVIVGAGSPDRADTGSLQREISADLPGLPGRMVHMPSPIPERHVVRLMGGAAAFCVPSLYEGFGLVALEAMACGAPTVVSNRGSLPEVVGEAGIVVEPTPDGLAGGLRLALSDGQGSRVLRVASRRRAETLSWERTVDGWVASLLAAAGG
jgi:glycosyltransferase involved in cell wall biosynthesis